MRVERMLGVALMSLMAVAGAHAQSVGSKAGNGAAVELKVRDSVTGRGLGNMAAVDIRDREGRSLPSIAAAHAVTPGARRFEVPPGLSHVKVSPPGYAVIQTRFELQSGEHLPVRIWLDPAELPEEMQPETIQSRIQEGKAMLHGHISDEVTGQPLRGASVRLEQQGEQTFTDGRGYFIFYGTLPRGYRPSEELPVTDNLVIKANGFKEFRKTGVLLAPGATHFIIEMQPGTGVVERDETHKLVKEARRGGGQLPPQTTR